MTTLPVFPRVGTFDGMTFFSAFCKTLTSRMIFIFPLLLLLKLVDLVRTGTFIKNELTLLTFSRCEHLCSCIGNYLSNFWYAHRHKSNIIVLFFLIKKTTTDINLLVQNTCIQQACCCLLGKFWLYILWI